MLVTGIDSDTKSVAVVTLDSERPSWSRYFQFGVKGRRAEDRIQALSTGIEGRFAGQDYGWVHIETPVMGVNAKALRDQAFVIGMLRHELWLNDLGNSLVDNGTWKKAVLGGGHASKEEIAQYAVQRFPQLEGESQDIMDAACIALFGLSTAQGGN